MQWIFDNWILILLGGGMLAMHLFGHKGHGSKGHGGGCCGGKPKPKPEEDSKPILQPDHDSNG
jgi:hypothetical protein